MKPVYQSTVDPLKGDCFSACLASLLEVPLDAIPRFAEQATERWGSPTRLMEIARPWLAENYGLSIVTIQMEQTLETGADIRIIGAVPGTPCIAGGRSATFESGQHAVVGEIDEHGMNFRMTHDPNPSGKGIIDRPIHLYFLVPLDYFSSSDKILLNSFKAVNSLCRDVKAAYDYHRAGHDRLRQAIIKHRSQKADDRCIEDDDELYAALGDGVKCDRRVGDNCARFIERRCEGGGWPTYTELEKALQLIADIGEGSTTANSLSNIARIARAALRPLPSTQEEVKEKV